MNVVVNDTKQELIEVDGKQYQRYGIKTHLVLYGDKIEDIVEQYALPNLQEGDILFITEKIVAVTQGRSYLVSEIKPRRLAKILCKFVYKTPYGIGLGIPETMEMALRECGTPRILFAAFISAIGKIFGKRGWFYQIAGYKASSIDGPTEGTLHPFDKSVVLGPDRPDEVAKELTDKFGYEIIISDINDIGGNILGTSGPHIDKELYARILKDNPLGQGSQQTPMGIIRPL